MNILTDKKRNLDKDDLEEDLDEDDSSDEGDEKQDKPQQNQLGMTLLPMRDDIRSIGLFGSIDAVKVATLVGALMDLSESDDSDEKEDLVPTTQENLPESQAAVEPKVKDPVETRGKPIEFLINTPGGEADEMFALYDIMRLTKTKCDIETFGLGKVMSAGVLILAAGTKGKRKIGKNCRVMIHNVMAGSVGSLHNLENEIKEIKYIQQSYISALSEESGMPVKKLQKLLNRKVNVYLSAEEAVNLGIADIIV
jgi:ATP-dependent Clp endopeptidase proteolytic subunit ClpP